MKNLHESFDRFTIRQNQILKSIQFKSEEIVQIRFNIKIVTEYILRDIDNIDNFNLIFYDKSKFQKDLQTHIYVRNRFVKYLNFKVKQLSELCNQLKEVSYDSE